MRTTQITGGARAVACIAALALGAFASSSFADITATYSFTLNANIPDGSGDFADMRTLGGFASYSNVAVNLNLGSQNASNPMWLGDLYSTLTIGLPSESERTAVLLNRPGRNNSDYYGSSLDSLNVTLDDSASHANIWGTTTGTGTYNSDGRSGVNPYAAGVAFNNGDRDATLSALNGSSLTSNRFTLLVADTEASGLARLNSWGMAVTGTAAGSGTMSADGGTLSIADDGGINNIGANVVTTQNGSGGVLNVTATGTLTFSGGMSGSGGLTKAGAGTVILSNATGNSYTGNTTVNAGTLLANNTSGSATGTGAVTVNNTGTLGGTGFINTGTNLLTVNSGGTLRGGDGTLGSTLSITNTGAGAVTLNMGSIIELALGPAISMTTMGQHSTLAITGSLNFYSAQMFHFLDFGATTGITYDNIITGVADPGTNISNWTITNSGWMGTFTWDSVNNSIDLTLTVVPEPGTWAAGILTVLALCWTQRKRFAKRFRVIS